MQLTDLLFLFNFCIWFVIGYLIYRKFYTSIEEILATTEIKKSRAMQYRAEHLAGSLKSSIFFSIIFSLAINLISLVIYSWVYYQYTNSVDFPIFSYSFFVYAGLFTIILYPLGELHYLCEKENEAETPHHQLLRKIIRKLVEKVKGKTEAVTVFALLFYLIPILILTFVLNLDFIFSIFIVFLIYPMLSVTYFIAYGIFKLFTPFIFLHSVKNIRLFVGLCYLGVIALFEVGLLIKESNFILGALIAFLLILVYSITKDLKYRPYELAHILDDVTRPFEWVHGSFLMLGFGLQFFMTVYLFIPIFQSLAIIIIPNFMEIFVLTTSFLIPVFLLCIIVTKSNRYSRALVVTLTKDSMKLNASIKSQFIHDRTLIETIEKSVNENYIRPEYTPKLNRLLNNEDTHVRRKAIVLLRRITEDDRFKSVSIVPNLLNFMKKDSIWTVRLEAAESLTNMMGILPKIEVKRIYEFLSELKPDKNRYVRWGIIKLFNSIALAREDLIDNVMEILFKGLEDEEWSVRKGTVESFLDIVEQFPTYIPDLLGRTLPLLNDEDLDIVKEVIKLIQKITEMEIQTDNLETVEKCITEKVQSKFKVDINLLKDALEKIKDAEAPKKFVFKHSDLPKK